MSDRTWAGHGISSSAKRRKCLPTDGGSVVSSKSTLSTSNPSTSVNSGTKNTESYRGEEYLLKGANSLSNTVLSTVKNLRFRNPSNRASATTIAKAVSTTASVSTADNGPGSSVPVPPVPHDCHYRKPSFTAPSSLSSRLIRTMCFLALITCTDLLSIPSADAKSKS